MPFIKLLQIDLNTSTRMLMFPMAFQWTYGEDVCDLNYVTANIFETNGNECVEVKEGSTRNVIERNICSNQLDVDSGCFSSRGDANTFR